MLDVMRLRYFWHGMTDQVTKVVNECSACDLKHLKPYNDPTLVSQSPSVPFGKVYLDLQGPWPAAVGTGNTYIMSVFESHFRCALAVGIRDKTAASVAWAFLNRVVLEWGVPMEVVCDRGGEFRREMLAMARALDIKVTRGAAYHPESQGAVERANGTIQQGIMSILTSKGLPASHWELYLPQVLFSMRVSKQAATKFSPFFTMFGVHPRVPKNLPDLSGLELPAPYVREGLLRPRFQAMEAAHTQAMANIARKQEKDQRDFARRRATATAMSPVPNPGDRVVVTMPPRQGSKRSGEAEYSPVVEVVSYEATSKTAQLRDAKGTTFPMARARLRTAQGRVSFSPAAARGVRWWGVWPW